MSEKWQWSDEKMSKSESKSVSNRNEMHLREDGSHQTQVTTLFYDFCIIFLLFSVFYIYFEHDIIIL